MQTALSTADIRYLIAWDATLRPCDLAHLARVSHDWQDVAEAALWADLPDLTYLLKLMPRNLWSYAPKQRTWCSAEPRYLRLMRAPIPSDWTPALRKSALVRRLTINCLHEVYCDDHASLELDDDPRISFVDSLHAIGSRISSLRLVITLDRQSDVDIPYLQQISKTPSLSSLRIATYSSSTASFRQPISYDASAFGFLRTLRTIGCPVIMVADIIRLAATRLEYIDFNHGGAVTAAELDLLVRAVCERCSASTLRDLLIIPKDYAEDDPLQHLVPLAQFKRLRLRFMNSNYAVRDGRLLMHIALCIPELCALVARDSVLSSADLARLALVSRTWRAAAEEVLWEDLSDILCLLRLLPEDLYYIETEPSTDDLYRSADERRVFKLRRKLRPADWTSLLRKSGLVKILTVASTVSAEVQQAIIECPSPLKVLPRLETLCLAKSANPIFLGAFVPLDAITALRITHSGASTYLSKIPLLQLCANIENLTLRLHLVGASKQAKAEELFKAVTETKRIRRLSLLLTMEFALPSERFMHFISRLPALTTLDIRLNRCDGARDYRPITYASHSFVHLRTLKLSRHSTQMLADILRASSPCRLHVIDLVYFSLEGADIEPLIATICTYCARSALRKLSIAASNFFGSADPQCLAPLASFEQLEVHFMDRAVSYT
ncbi:uncharacterized protein SCHCODRAFT_02673843 [Schizophyllum commune H4-8]|nr:uncharacterized protein SCHCODRAFT_02673843 [Schizophyllum commune H4-8]KAI5884826.1 hypothetical protein SCHCODRAFT_02673843 [Schizophyllum commune H4-8]